MALARIAQQWLREASARLRDAGIAEPESEARRLLSAASGVDALEWWTHPERALEPDALERAEGYLALRCAREPLAYVLGSASFFGREFQVDRGVLVPREDSGALIELALELVPDREARVLDAGVGSGCLLATLLLERPRWRGCGVDLDARALRCAQGNLARYALAARARLWRGAWLAALRPSPRFDLVVANPPYVTPSELARCEPEVRDREPRRALLVPEEDPLQPYRQIAERWSEQARGAVLVCEVGATRADAVAALLRAHGARAVRTRDDLGGVPRAVAGVL